jgi:hypothetical protein
MYHKILVIIKTRNKGNGKNVGSKGKMKKKIPEGLRSEQERTKRLSTFRFKVRGYSHVSTLISYVARKNNAHLKGPVQILTFILVILAARGVEEAGGERLPLEQVRSSLRLVGHRHHSLCGQHKHQLKNGIKRIKETSGRFLSSGRQRRVFR